MGFERNFLFYAKEPEFEEGATDAKKMSCGKEEALAEILYKVLTQLEN